MDLKSGYPFWAVKNGLMQAFPPLDRDERCDVAIVGAGITGALIADELAAHGHDVVVLDQRDVGWGSTAASTALVQYEIDTPLTDLARRYGEDDAVLAFRACADAVDRLAALARDVGDVGFSRMKSLYYASAPRDGDALRDEFAARRRHGFDVRWLGANAVARRYGLQAHGAILNRPAARIDPYRMTYRLLRRHDARVYDRTRVERMRVHARGVELVTAHGSVHARHVVIAAGYASQLWLKQRVARNRSSYAFVTDPIARERLGPLVDTLVWETARPYLYLRSTADGRVLVGGEDDAVDIPARRDVRVERKARALLHKASLMFPRVPFEPVFSWAGTFAETRDGLPFFGAHAEHGPRVLFAMAYGGNGITYSVLGAALLRATIERRAHPLAALFGYARLDR